LRTQQDEFDRQTVLAENRLRFQQDHLETTRHDLEQEQNDHRRTMQRHRADTEQSETLLRLRTTQLDHYLMLLEERELSVKRERDLIAKLHRSVDSESANDRKRLQSDRESWEESRQAQRAELQRQQNMLTLHAENLESRRARLDQLRADLEETHRSTLEMRMGVEEAWAQMCQTHGTAAAKERVDRAREALSEHYHTLRESLSQQRTELEEARTSLRGERDEFRNERQTLTEWITERDDGLRLREEQLRKEAGALQSQEAEWQAIQERWIHEKVEAEEIIRDLLGQLTEITSPSPTAHSEPITPTQTPPGDWTPAARVDTSWEPIDPQTPTDPRD
jgi:hypothetical protein